MNDWRSIASLSRGENEVFVEDGLIYPARNTAIGFKGLLIITDLRLIIISYKYKGILKTEINGYDKIEYDIKLDNIEGYISSEKIIVGKSVELSINPRLFPKSEKDLEIKLDKNLINTFYVSLSSSIDSLKEKKAISTSQNQVKTDDEKVVKERIIIKELVKIKCRCCGNLYDQGINKCPHCGAST
jgi:hypothetical protein